MRFWLALVGGLLMSGLLAAQTGWRVIGSPSSQGRDRLVDEQQFLLQALPVPTLLRPAEASGWPAHETLRALRAGFVDLALLQASTLGADLPLLLTGAVPGLHTTVDASQAALARLRPQLAAELAVPFQAELLALVPVGGSYLFCRQALPRLADLRGRRVRLHDEAQASVLLALGATPLPPLPAPSPSGMPDDAPDCEIATLRAALFGGLAERLPHAYGLRLQLEFGLVVVAQARLQREAQMSARLRDAAQAYAAQRWRQIDEEDAALQHCLRTRQGCARFGTTPREAMQWQAAADGDAEHLRATAAGQQTP